MKEGLPPPINPQQSQLARAIEQRTGESIESLQDTPIDVRRKLIETRHGKPMQVISLWPFIGRGEPPQLLSRAEINKLVDKALK